MSLNAHDVSQLRAALQDAVVKCSERCLYHSAKWAAELLTSLPDTPEDDATGAAPSASAAASHVPAFFSPNPDPEEALLEVREANKFLLAKALFDCREFDRCTALFLPEHLVSSILNSHTDAVFDTTSGGRRPGGVGSSANIRSRHKGKGKGKATATATSESAPREAGEDGKNRPVLPRISQKSLFLALYAKVLSGEKRRNEDTEMIMGPQDLGNVVNKQLTVVSRLLAAWFEARRVPDGKPSAGQGWLEYLYGMVLAKEKNEPKAILYLIRSVHIFPMNWGCWLELTSLISRVEDLNRVARSLPRHIFAFMFHLHTSLELYQQNAGLANSVEELLAIFPTSPFLLACKALHSYHAKDLVAAEQGFSNLLKLHPLRLDVLDHYSNILYVMNMRSRLAFLAHLCVSVDRFRPESCVVIGNYYSLLSMHEKAVQQFRRALTLDRNCLSAWTLMGHEFVELKNTHAAIESYRRAVCVNRRDYRAWYGLGQTYEMLEMNIYALHYYKKAAGLRPWDGKMWHAVGSCLQRVGRVRDAIMALKRALVADVYDEASGSLGDPASGSLGHLDPDILLQIGLMHEMRGEEDEARAYMEICITQEDGGAAAAEAEAAEAEAAKAAAAAAAAAGPSSRLISFGRRDDSHSKPRSARRPEQANSPMHHMHSGPPKRPEDGGGGATEGTGVTAATTTARKWLAKYAMRHADYFTAHRLATELCEDGADSEDAKALVREIRSRMEAAGLVPPIR